MQNFIKLGISLGDPNGIGPEVILKALLEEAAKVGQLKWQEVNEWLREVERITRITRIAGIEPTQTVLKTAVLPLNYTPKKVCRE